MSVHAIRRVRGQGCVRPATTAGQLMSDSHPLNAAFIRFCGHNPPTKRQAARFLQKFPQFRDIKTV